MMIGNIRLTAAIACNLTMAVWTAFCLVHDFTAAEGRPEPAGARTFRYYTVDSNVLLALSALVTAAFEALRLTGTLQAVPFWVTVLKYVATVSVTLTMLTVLFFLGPTQGYRKMLSGDDLYLHLIGPLLAIFTFCVLEPAAVLTLRDTLYAVFPTIVYGVVYLILVVGKEKWPDFYGFNAGGMWPLSMAAVYSAAWGISLLIRFLHNLSL